jgi:hypothetical protein
LSDFQFHQLAAGLLVAAKMFPGASLPAIAAIRTHADAWAAIDAITALHAQHG